MKNLGYSDFKGEDRTKVLAEHGETIKSFDALTKKSVAFSNEMIPDVIVRQPFTRTDYEYFRPNEAIPEKFKDVIKMCRACYSKVGIIRNVIDLMIDFVCDGFDIEDKNKDVNKFFKLWIKQTKFRDCIYEFAKHLLIDNNVVVKRITGKMTTPMESYWKKLVAGVDVKIYKPIEELYTKEIPWRYYFLNILTLEWLGGDIAKFADSQKLAITVSQELSSKGKSNSPEVKDLLDQLPEDIRENIKKGKSSKFPLDMSKIYISQGLKDSWETWATPTLQSILSDVVYKQKLRQAEISALDGVINVIRLWKLGDHKEGVLPNQEAIDKLLGLLQANTGGGAMDLVWDSMISMEEFYPPIDKILGPEKYVQVDKDILIGLGVPEVLLGGKGSNFSNSFIQLKTLKEKLENVRRKLYDFILNEVQIICNSMNIKTIPVIRFNEIADDEASTKKLIVGLFDRGIISADSVLQLYGRDYEIEKTKRKKEDSEIEIKGPFKSDEVENKQGGRPPMTKDDSPRKFRQAKPRTNAIKAMSIIESIYEFYTPIYLESIGVKNLRQLSNKQKEELDEIRGYILSCINSSDNINNEDDMIRIIKENRQPNELLLSMINKNISDFVKETGSYPSLSQRKLIESLSWEELMEDL